MKLGLNYAECIDWKYETAVFTVLIDVFNKMFESEAIYRSYKIVILILNAKNFSNRNL